MLFVHSAGFPEELRAQTCRTPAVIPQENEFIQATLGRDQELYYQFEANLELGILFRLQIELVGSATVFFSQVPRRRRRRRSSSSSS